MPRAEALTQECGIVEIQTQQGSDDAPHVSGRSGTRPHFTRIFGIFLNIKLCFKFFRLFSNNGDDNGDNNEIQKKEKKKKKEEKKKKKEEEEQKKKNKNMNKQ